MDTTELEKVNLEELANKLNEMRDRFYNNHHHTKFDHVDAHEILSWILNHLERK